MTYYLLPRGNLHTYKNLKYSHLEADEVPKVSVSNSVAQYLYGMKENIDDNDKKWDTFKKYTNPCEYIHTTIPFKKKSVSKTKPISRSYFKMIEILHLFPIIPRNNHAYTNAPHTTQYSTQHPMHSPIQNPTQHSTQHSTQHPMCPIQHSTQYPPITTFHLAEAPGGFIEAIAKTRQHQKDTYYGMTLLNDCDQTIPSWKKGVEFMKEFAHNILLENGADGTGNILSLENFEHVYRTYGGKMDVVTGDGGFDFSTDFNQQEIAIGKLLFAQIAYAVCIQKYGGSFVLKLFDCFMDHTIDLIFLLSTMYEKVYIVKPQTSRYANSEKYIVCTGFLLEDPTEYYPYFYRCFTDMSQFPDMHVRRFLDTQPNFLFLQKIEEYNAIYAQKQIMNIQYTISLIECKNKHDKIEGLIRTNVQKSVNWCIKYGVPYHLIAFTPSMNVFL